ncbi:MAG TPA: hypothetical protein VMW75_14730 [Thermoanaerobaculia bacterium]|nr:hypothetical protein [Thermoanaerobaculia bacterium]
MSAEPRHDCVVIGLPGCGKSSLLGALTRVSGATGEDGAEVRLIAGEALTALAAEVAQSIGEGDPAPCPTLEPASYDLQVEVRDRPGGDAVAREILIQEWPGGAIAWVNGLVHGPPGQSRVKPLLETVRGAHCLVLCVDALAPRRRLWDAVLPSLISDLATASGELLPRLGLAGRGDLPPVMSSRRQLPFAAVLLLLTKVDRLCAAAADAIERAGVRQRIPLDLDRLARSQAGLARCLDPSRFAADRLGDAWLDQLRGALRPGARLAVGLTSARGFTVAGAQGGGWLPFGVREALRFIVDGVARHPLEAVATSPVGGEA